MSTLLRKIIFCLIGILSGLTVWPIVETVLSFHGSFPTFLIFNLILGGLLGGFIGGFLGTVEGVTLSLPSRIIPGLIAGAIIGMIGGAIGYFVGQSILLFLEENIVPSITSLKQYGIPLSRSFSWAILGVFAGSVEGIRSKSGTKIKVGIAGGFIGGFIGGLLLEYLPVFFPDFIYARLVGIMVLGGSIGLFYGWIESKFAKGILKLLNGKLKGKEYLLLQGKTKVGQAKKTDIQLIDYSDVAALHATFSLKKGEVQVMNSDPKNLLRVNDQPVKDQTLKLEDVIQIGSAKFLFYYA